MRYRLGVINLAPNKPVVVPKPQPEWRVVEPPAPPPVKPPPPIETPEPTIDSSAPVGPKHLPLPSVERPKLKT
jgi:hypothetical protein